MQAMRTVLTTAIVVSLGLGAANSEAKRLGSTAAKGSSSAARHADDGPKAPGVTISPSFRSSAAGSAAGTVAGSAAAKAMTAADKEQPEAEKAETAEEKRQSRIASLRRQAEIEEAAKEAERTAQAAEMHRKAELAAKAEEEAHRQEALAAKRRAAEEQQAELKRVAIERERSCVIKPAMTDAEIGHCKWVWSFPPP